MKPAKPNSTNLLTDVERRWYQCFSADILSRRFVWEQLGVAFQLILAGSCGILGILWLGWSSEQEFAFIVIGLWVGSARNIVKITCMFQGMQNLVKNFEETGGVSNIWYIVNRIKYPGIKDHPDARQNLIGIQQSRGKLVEQVGCGTGADLVMGGVSTGIMVIMAMKGDFRFHFAAITSGGFLWPLAGFLAYEIWLTVIQVYDFRRHREERLVMMYPGFTGAGLLLLMVIVLMTNDYFQQASTNWTMFVIYAVIASWGFLKILWAIMTWRKTVWLTSQLTRK
jgi:hypothetical protein